MYYDNCINFGQDFKLFQFKYIYGNFKIQRGTGSGQQTAAFD
jgi:hypothetical protein